MRKNLFYLRSLLFCGLFLVGATTFGGCKASCESDSDIENAAEDLGDKIEDAADELD